MRRTQKRYYNGESKFKVAKHRHQATVKKNQTRRAKKVGHPAKIHRERGIV